MSKRVALVFGTRPEAIKLAPVYRELAGRAGLVPMVIVTAQHRKMLDQILDLFKIPVDHDLNIMEEQQTLFRVSSKAIDRLEGPLEKSQLDFMIVQGDTTTTFVGALGAFYRRVPVGHVEAGLRTADKYRPFPEEVNRRLTTVLADLHFAPTETAAANLRREGIADERILVTGNTVIDALLATYDPAEGVTGSGELSRIDPTLRTLLVTAHRRENWGEVLGNICGAVRRVVDEVRDVQVVFSVHLNPAVRSTVRSVLGDIRRVHLTGPLDYHRFVQLMGSSYLVLTDSGGIQEEAPSLGKPVLVARDVTERPEGVEAGTVKVAGTSEEGIYSETVRLLRDESAYKSMAHKENPYGDGHAAERIVDAVEQFLR